MDEEIIFNWPMDKIQGWAIHCETCDELIGPAIISATIANCHRDSKTKAFTPADFLPKPPEKTLDEYTEQDIAALKKKMAAVFATSGIKPTNS